MAILPIKKHIVNSKGELELLNIYSTRDDACDIGLPCKRVEVPVKSYSVDRDENNSSPVLNFKEASYLASGFLGLTEDINKAKASSKRVSLNGKLYAERKYMGTRSMCSWLSITYPTTFETMTEIPAGDLPDTSDCQDFSYAFSRGRRLDHMSEIDTSSGINFEGMFAFNEYRSLLPTMDTSKGTNMARFVDSCIALVTMGVDTGNAETLEAYAHNCKELVHITKLNTAKAKNISRLVDECVALTDIPPIDLTSMEYEDIMNYDKALHAFRNTSSLGELTFNNVPIGLTEQDVRQAMSIMPSCSIVNLNYRNVRYKPVEKVIRAVNGELVENNIANAYVDLIRVGNEPLNKYIKHKSAWGTIYSDNPNDISNPLNFGCFITPDDRIYVGNSYENVLDTLAKGKYGVMSFVNGNLDISALDDTASNEMKCVQIKGVTAGDYILSYDTNNNFSIEGLINSGESGFDILVDKPTHKSYMFHLDGTVTEITFLVKDGATHKTGFETLLSNIMIVKSSVDLPYVPIGIKVPRTRLLLRNTVSTMKNISMIIKGVDFGKNATFNLFTQQTGTDGLNCVVENYKLDIDLLCNKYYSCITKGLTSIDTSTLFDFQDLEIVGDTSGIGITLKSINLFNTILSKDELRKAQTYMATFYTVSRDENLSDPKLNFKEDKYAVIR